MSNLNNVMSGVNPPQEPDYVDVRVEMLMPKVGGLPGRIT